MREFYAANSAGQFDLQYSVYLPTPIELNTDGSRPSNWRYQAKQYATWAGFAADDFYAHVFDISSLPPSADEPWDGLYLGQGDVAIRTVLGEGEGPDGYSQIVVNHEMGHRLGADHAETSLPRSTGAYYWDPEAQAYATYHPGIDPHQPLPFGARRDEYGNPFDTMGNIGHGHFRIGEKLNLDWIDDSRVPDLNTLGGGTYRVYAHDELEVVGGGPIGMYGVAEGYSDDVLYGLTFDRIGEYFDASLGEFMEERQTIHIEYRAGLEGPLFYLDDKLIDLDPVGANYRSDSNRSLCVGESIEDVDFGLSTYLPETSTIDFLEFDPPPPTDPTVLRPEWFRFEVLSLGSDSIGSYAEIGVTLVQPASVPEPASIATLTILLLYQALWGARRRAA